MLYCERLLSILIFQGNSNAVQVIIMTLNLWGHQYYGDWGRQMNWCVKLRVGDYPTTPPPTSISIQGA